MKKNTVKNSVMATVLATSLFSSSGVSFASSSLQDMVDQARKDMKEESYAYVVPAQQGKIMTSKDLYPALNTAKESYQKAKAAIEKSKSKNKKALLNDLEDLYNERITKGVVPYIDAYNYATKYITPIMDAIEKAESKKDSAEVEKQLQKLTEQLKERSAIMYRFTGKASRDLLLATFKTPADKKHAQLMVSRSNVSTIKTPPLYNSNSEQLTVKQVARYDSGQGETGTEILAYDEKLKKAFVTNGAIGGFDILSFADVKSGEFTQVDSTKRVVIEDYGVKGVKNITSITSHPTEDLIAIAAYAEKTDLGYIIFATKDGKFVKSVQVGALPDMVTFTPDGKKVVVANEGEPNKDTTIDPEGSISIIDVASFEETTLTFTEAMLDENVRMSYQGKGSSYLAQLEPEYVTVSLDSKTAYVTLQENNAIATVDLVNNKIVSVKGLGVIDHSITGNEMDANKDDKAIGIDKAPILTWHMPDAVDTFVVHGKTYIIIPNEGDSRDYVDDGGYTEVADLADIELPIKLDATKYQGYTQEELDKFDLSKLDGYKVTTENGINAEATSYEAIYGYGGRSFSIFDAESLEQVYDSGSEFERIIAEKTPKYFNTNSDEIKVDNRSDDKGPEPETAVVGEIDGTTYGFIALERYSGIMVYDLTDVKAPKFVTLISSRDFSEDAAGDVSPEGLLFIPAEKSPTGKALLAATHEISGTVAVYEFEEKAKEAN
ncbi:choice-of-anchor I family protein [Psychrobacillus sp. NPDC093180]|uniref:choice-of-anchor I family protein n=1 Tax=Psychrobacillus sp. NPDC093180 TaxID=3364489 RepID=UPI00380FFBC5